jgi:hypothetical protein
MKHLLEASVFGDRFLAPLFHRLAHNRFVDRYFPSGTDSQLVPYELIIWIYDNLPKDDPIFSLVVELQCVVWEIGFDDEEEQLLRPQLPHEFLVSVMIKFDDLRKHLGTTMELKACDYHLHSSEEEKKACLAKSKK